MRARESFIIMKESIIKVLLERIRSRGMGSIKGRMQRFMMVSSIIIHSQAMEQKLTLKERNRKDTFKNGYT